MTNMKLLTNVSAIIESDNPESTILLKADNNSKTINTYLMLEDYPDFDTTQSHKVYMDDKNKVLIKCSGDLLDPGIDLSVLMSNFVDFKPAYKYDEYV